MLALNVRFFMRYHSSATSTKTRGGGTRRGGGGGRGACPQQAYDSVSAGVHFWRGTLVPQQESRLEEKDQEEEEEEEAD